jgi:hypothetical protein
VPEYDAFGREIGENTLSGLGGEAGAAPPQPPAEPAPAPPPSDGWTTTAPPQPAPEPAQVTFSVPDGAPVTVMPTVRRRRMGGLGCLIGLVILAAVVAGPVIAVFSIVGSASDVIDDVTDAIDDRTAIVPDVPDPPTEPTGITGRSLIAEDNLSAALRRIEQDGFAKAERVTVRPAGLDADTVKGGRGRSIQIGYDGAITRGDASPTRAPFGTIRLASLDPAAPARLVRGSAERYRVKPKGVTHIIAGPGFDGGQRWVAYFKNGIYVEGDAKGRVTRRID